MRLIDADKIKWRPTVSTMGLVIPEGQAYFVRKADIDDMPAVEAEPIRHGKWKNLQPCSPVFECTLCKYHNFIKSNYCPNCGVKMGGKENKEET